MKLTHKNTIGKTRKMIQSLLSPKLEKVIIEARNTRWNVSFNAKENLSSKISQDTMTSYLYDFLSALETFQVNKSEVKDGYRQGLFTCFDNSTTKAVEFKEKLDGKIYNNYIFEVQIQ